MAQLTFVPCIDPECPLAAVKHGHVVYIENGPATRTFFAVSEVREYLDEMVAELEEMLSELPKDETDEIRGKVAVIKEDVVTLCASDEIKYLPEVLPEEDKAILMVLAEDELARREAARAQLMDQIAEIFGADAESLFGDEEDDDMDEDD